MTTKISAYWKCQLLGWGIVVSILYVYNNIIYTDYLGFLYKSLIIFVFGITFSHFLRITTRKLGVFNFRFSKQIVWLFILNLLFSIVVTFIWLTLLIKSTLYNYPFDGESVEPFYKVYLFNLLYVFFIFSGWSLIYFLVHYVKSIREQERQKILDDYKIIELEAKALRAQMNPHFIFNCMNSIKSLMQKNENEKAITYLTTFSKLIRTVFQNSDKKEITLHDEVETCRLYTQLESMRFNNKFSHEFYVDETLDLKSVMVPALIVQPFIENAIWHGIMPKEEGGKLTVRVVKTDHTISCIIEDDGIGRAISIQNKFLSKDSMHESKGERLTQTRLDLDNSLNERNASIEIVDKTDVCQKTFGTTVILTFKEY